MKYKIMVEYNEDHTTNKEHVVTVDNGLQGAALLQAIERQLDILHGDRKAIPPKSQLQAHVKGAHPVEQHDHGIRDWRQWHLLGTFT